MDKLKILPAGKRSEISREKADSILIANFPFTKLDSTLAEFSIIMLTGAYPFVPQGTPNYKMLNYKMSDIVDSLAAAIKNRDIMWENGHAKLAEHYFNKGDYGGFMREMDAIIAERPFFDVPYENVIVRLIDNELLEESIPYLLKLHSLKPSHFTNKWLGQVYLKLNDAVKSLPYLIAAAKYPEADYRVFYNLAGAYYLTGSLDLALSSIERSLQLNPRNPLAQNLYTQLKGLQ
jgi:tetratricopeptide (TPR) repeat protein